MLKGDKPKREKLVKQWKDTADTLLQSGDILLRIGVFAALVYGVYYSINLVVSMSQGYPFVLGRGKPFDMLINALITFSCMGVMGILAERQFHEKKFRQGGILALAIGAVLLVSAQIAGLIILGGGFIMLLAVELKRPWVTFQE